METMTFGILALSFLIVSCWCVSNKKCLFGICGNIASVVFTILSGYSWRKMLIDSGKDTTVLGFHSYPAAPVILLLLLIFAIIMMVISAIMMARTKTIK